MALKQLGILLLVIVSSKYPFDVFRSTLCTTAVAVNSLCNTTRHRRRLIALPCVLEVKCLILLLNIPMHGEKERLSACECKFPL